jgi:hypothetical protein
LTTGDARFASELFQNLSQPGDRKRTTEKIENIQEHIQNENEQHQMNALINWVLS